MGNFVRAYLRASTDEQDPTRAKQALQDFADKHGLPIAKFYVEQASGNKINRPKLNELLDDCTNGDILLLESIDRLSQIWGKPLGGRPSYDYHLSLANKICTNDSILT